MNLLAILGPLEIVIILLFSMGFFVLPILAVIDIVRSKFEGNNQLIWIIVVVFFNVIGSILYFIIGRNQRIQQ